jgi:signal transduction histidine kinase
MPLTDTQIHALKTPLTSVIGYAESLRQGEYGPINPEQTEAIDVIIKRSRELLAILDRVRSE